MHIYIYIEYIIYVVCILFDNRLSQDKPVFDQLFHALAKCCRCSVDAVPPVLLGPRRTADTKVQVTARLDLLPPNAGGQLQVSCFRHHVFLSTGKQSHMQGAAFVAKRMRVDCENKSAQVYRLQLFYIISLFLHVCKPLVVQDTCVGQCRPMERCGRSPQIQF